MANEIKKINVGGVDYTIVDEAAARDADLATVAKSGKYTDLTNRAELSLTDATEESTADTVNVVSQLATSGTDNHTVTVTKIALPTKTYVDKIATGHVKYLGTVDALTGLSTTAGQGDFYRVSTAFTFGSETAHVGDIILAIKDNPSQKATD